MNRSALLAMVILGLASCSRAPDGESEAPAAYDNQPAETASGPDISPTAAPGVAFNYAYTFRLPAIRIADVQEEHAQACEKLGVTQCRITGLRYQVLGENRIQAMLAFKLAPELARNFGKQGIAAVQKAEGMVIDTSIGGTAVGTAISAARRNEQEIARQIAQLEAELAKGGLKPEARQELISRIESLRSTRRQNADSRAENEDALASTPVVFNYGSGGLIPGFDPESPIVDALRTAGRMFVEVIAFLIIAASVLLPLGLALAILALLYPRVRRLYRRLAGGGPGAGE